MTAISSHRPFADCPAEIVAHQIAANQSWQQAFDRIIYFGEPEPQLAGGKVSFLPCTGKPPIAMLCALAAGIQGWSCIINADIIVGEDWARAQYRLHQTYAEAALSLRWQFRGDRAQAQVTDLGLDFFAAKPEVWAQAAKKVPLDFHLGRILWDTWMIAFLMEVTGGNCADLTPTRVFFHPVHEGRKDQGMEPPKDAYLNRVKWPILKINL